MSATHGKKSQILLTSTPSLSFANLALTDSGDHTTFYVGSGSSSKRYWDSSQTLTFQTSPDGSTWNSATPASVRYISGSVTFASAVTGGTPSARVSAGFYFPYAALAWVDEWSADLSRDVKEDTRMTTTGTPVQWRTFVGGLFGGTFKLTGFVIDATVSNLAIATNDVPLIASLVLNTSSNTRFECAGFLTKDSIKANVDDLLSEELDFQITGAVYLLLS